MKSKKKGIPNIDQFVSDCVRKQRKANNISQAQLAHLLEVSEGFIANIENVNHRAKYNLNHLNQLAVIFKCSPAVFFPENTDKKRRD